MDSSNSMFLCTYNVKVDLMHQFVLIYTLEFAMAIWGGAKCVQGGGPCLKPLSVSFYEGLRHRTQNELWGVGVHYYYKVRTQKLSEGSGLCSAGGCSPVSS